MRYWFLLLNPVGVSFPTDQYNNTEMFWTTVIPELSWQEITDQRTGRTVCVVLFLWTRYLGNRYGPGVLPHVSTQTSGDMGCPDLHPPP